MIGLLVSGTGRCGTGYMARVLREAGLRAGHEGAFNLAAQNWNAELDVDVSWLAAPHWGDRQVHRILLWREPHKVIASLHARRTFHTDSEWRLYKARWIPQVMDPDPHVAACAFWAGWNALALEADPHLIVNVDDVPWELVQRLLPVAPRRPLRDVAAGVPTNVNSDGAHATVDADALTAECYRMRDLLAARSGSGASG